MFAPTKWCFCHFKRSSQGQLFPYRWEGLGKMDNLCEYEHHLSINDWAFINFNVFYRTMILQTMLRVRQWINFFV